MIQHRISLLLWLLISAFPVFGQQTVSSRQDIFISPVIEVNSYAKEGVGLGFGLAVGAGDRLAIGIKPLFAISFGDDSIKTLELAFFMRYYIFRAQPNTGLFAQLDAGGAVYLTDYESTMPAEFGSLSIGVGAGWRFSLWKGIFLEPFVRLGYPYGFGAGVYAGYRF